MTVNSTIGQYVLWYYGKRQSDASAIARIRLYNENQQYIGYVDFFRDGQTIPDNSSTETIDPKRAYLRMHERQIDSVVDMLRNEKPCKMWYSV